MQEKQSFQISLLFMGQFFLFFLTPWPVVELEACWKGPPFILISACALVKACPRGPLDSEGVTGTVTGAWPGVCSAHEACAAPVLGRLLPTWLRFPGTGHPSRGCCEQTERTYVPPVGDMLSPWGCQEVVLPGRRTRGSLLPILCAVVPGPVFGPCDFARPLQPCGRRGCWDSGSLLPHGPVARPATRPALSGYAGSSSGRV